MSATPILDRQRALPAPAPRRSEMRVVYVVWSFILAAFVISVIAGRPSWLRRWLLAEMPRLIDRQRLVQSLLSVAATVVVVSFVMVAVHEAGHVAGGLVVGFRFRSIRVGPLQLDWPFRLSVSRRPGNPFAGAAAMIPVTTEGLVPRGRILVLSGPAANILSGCCVLLLPIPMGLPSLLFVVQSIGNGLSDLLPYRSALGVSDGRFLWALFRDPARAARWLAAFRLRMDVSDGVLPESLPADFIELAVALQDDSLDTVTTHALAFLAAYHQHRNADAARLLETCLTFASRAQPTLREALISEAAVLQARRRGRADLAEQWLADLSPSTPQWIRCRTEAAVLEARGDALGAAAKLDQCARELASSNLPVREYSLRLLQRWRSELNASS